MQLSAGSKSSEFALVILVIALGAVIWLVSGPDQGQEWLDATWPLVGTYAVVRGATKAVAARNG